jgi:hypothetical protein
VAWPIYSERFLSDGASAGYVYFYVPAGRRAVLNHVAIVNQTAEAGTVQVEVNNVRVVFRTLQASDRTVYYDMRIPVYAGEPIAMFKDHAYHSVTLSGYLFDDPSGRTGMLETSGAAPLPAPPEQGPEPR